MPLSKKRDRARKKQSNLTGLESKGKSNLIQPKKQEKLVKLRKLIEQVQVESEPVKSQPIIEILVDKPKWQAHSVMDVEPNDRVVVPTARAPLYRRGFHKKGDLVRMPGSNIEVVVPDIDADGREY